MKEKTFAVPMEELMQDIESHAKKPKAKSKKIKCPKCGHSFEVK